MTATDPAVGLAPRATARAAAEQAIGDWVRAVTADVTAFAGRVAGDGPDRLVMFSARPGADDQFFDEQAELTAVTIAGPARVVTLTRDGGQPWLWAEAAALWNDLRDAEAASMSAEVPISWVLAVDERIVAGYEPLHCGHHGPEPVLLAEVSAAGAAPTDPFDALLDDDAYFDRLTTRVAELLDRYRLDPPSSPAPTGCDEGA